MANANIFAQYLRAPRSVADYSADLDKQEAADLQLSQARQARADDNALRQAARSFGADADANYRTLLQAGLPTQAMAYRKGAIENDAKRAEIAKNTAQTGNFTSEANARDFDVKVKKFGQAITDIASYQTPQQALQQLQAHMQAGDIDPQKAAIIARQLQSANTPGSFAQWQVGMLRGMMSAKDALESQKLRFQTNNLGGQTVTQGLDPFTGAQVSQVSQQNTQSPDNAATQATAMRGQNMADARAREATSVTLSKPFEVTGPDGQPMLVQMSKDGKTITPVEGFGPRTGASKPLTDSQSKALLFGSRAREANNILESLSSQGTVTGVPGAGGNGALSSTVTALSSEKQQQLNQAKRDFLTAVLRRESGAVINDSEFANGDKQYFPQIGDKPAVIAQKKQNRKLAEQGILAEVPDGKRDSLAQTKVINFGDLK